MVEDGSSAAGGLNGAVSSKAGGYIFIEKSWVALFAGAVPSGSPVEKSIVSDFGEQRHT